MSRESLEGTVLNMFTEHVQSPRAEQRERTRGRVVDCAQHLFLAHGFRATTIRQIAREAGVSVGTVMAVGDKDALLLAAFDRWIGGIHEARAAGRITHDRSAPPAAQIGDLVQPFLDLFDADLALAREYGAILARGTHRTAVFTELAVSLTSEFIVILRTAGLGEDAEPAGRAIYLAYLGLLMASAALGAGVSAVRGQLEDVAGVLVRRAGDHPSPAHHKEE